MTRQAWRALACAAAACTVLVPAGCNIAAPVAYAVYGPGKVQKQYELDSAKTHLVLVDDPMTKVTVRNTRDEIGRTAQEYLLQKGVIDDAVDTRAASALAQRGGDQRLSIQEIGEAFEADVVIYVLIGEFNPVPLAGDETQAAVSMNVKVIDVTTGERLWPEEPNGFALRMGHNLRPEQLRDAGNRSDLLRQQQALAARAGLAIGQLFKTVERPDSVLR